MAAKKKNVGSNIENCSFVMNLEADGATRILAEALQEQARANKAASEAMMQLAKSLKPIDACAIRITNGGIEI